MQLKVEFDLVKQLVSEKFKVTEDQLTVFQKQLDIIQAQQNVLLRKLATIQNSVNDNIDHEKGTETEEWKKPIRENIGNLFRNTKYINEDSRYETDNACNFMLPEQFATAKNRNNSNVRKYVLNRLTRERYDFTVEIRSFLSGLSPDLKKLALYDKVVGQPKNSKGCKRQEITELDQKEWKTAINESTTMDIQQESNLELLIKSNWEEFSTFQYQDCQPTGSDEAFFWSVATLFYKGERLDSAECFDLYCKEKELRKVS